MSEESERQLEKLRKAKELELWIRQVVLDILHSQGVIAMDTNAHALDSELERLIIGEG